MLQQVSLEDEFLLYVGIAKSQVITAAEIYDLHIMKRRDTGFPCEQYEAIKALDSLVKEGRLIRLFPEGVSPERAGMAQTYYTLSPQNR